VGELGVSQNMKTYHTIILALICFSVSAFAESSAERQVFKSGKYTLVTVIDDSSNPNRNYPSLADVEITGDIDKSGVVHIPFYTSRDKMEIHDEPLSIAGRQIIFITHDEPKPYRGSRTRVFSGELVNEEIITGRFYLLGIDGTIMEQGRFTLERKNG
jgi:hypothetical protein